MEFQFKLGDLVAMKATVEKFLRYYPHSPGLPLAGVVNERITREFPGGCERAYLVSFNGQADMLCHDSELVPWHSFEFKAEHASAVDLVAALKGLMPPAPEAAS